MIVRPRRHQTISDTSHGEDRSEYRTNLGSLHVEWRIFFYNRRDGEKRSRATLNRFDDRPKSS